MYPFFHLAAFTGAPRGELLNLTWPMVDLAGGALVITGSASVVEAERTVGTTKGGRRHTVTIDPLRCGSCRCTGLARPKGGW
jgi:integrase